MALRLYIARSIRGDEVKVTSQGECAMRKSIGFGGGWIPDVEPEESISAVSNFGYLPNQEEGVSRLRRSKSASRLPISHG